MPLYTYQATDKKGKLTNGEMDGRDEAAIVSKLHDLNLHPIKIKPHKENSKSIGQAFRLLPFKFKGSSKDILGFTQKLTTLITSGLTLDRSLQIMVELNDKESLKQAIEGIHKDVHSGKTLAESLSNYPNIFSKLYVNMVKAGEEGGVLDIILARLTLYLEKKEHLKENIVSAMIYPAILLSVGLISIILLMTFVVPRFAIIFSEMGQAIPLPTKILLGLCDFLISYWWLIAGVIIGTIVGIKKYYETDKGKLKTDSISAKLPLIGEIQQMNYVANFSRTLGTLLKSGVPILQSLSITADTMTNAIIVSNMGEIYKKIKRGTGIATPLKESKAFPPLAIHMIQVGEETGKIEEMLLKVANIYDDEIEKTVKRFLAIVEPVMILGMAIVVGFIVISMLMAIFSINELPI